MCTLCFNHREIVDNHEKENALNIVTEDRTYQIYAESPEDARYFFNCVYKACGCKMCLECISVYLWCLLVVDFICIMLINVSQRFNTSCLRACVAVAGLTCWAESTVPLQNSFCRCSMNRLILRTQSWVFSLTYTVRSCARCTCKCCKNVIFTCDVPSLGNTGCWAYWLCLCLRQPRQVIHDVTCV